uniref:Uncharacterized protein n=1 Tax=viral metagenome TaxID=1070528 RepID=A0A6C0BC66_9ZZZZ
MSLAMYAAPFDNDINEINTSDQISKKRAANHHNKTQKNYSKEGYSEKVNSVLQSINNLPDNEGDSLGDFQPIPPPMSAGVEQTRLRDSIQGTNFQQEKSMFSSNVSTSQHAMPANISMADVEMQKRFIPNYETIYKDQPQNNPINPTNPNNVSFYNTQPMTTNESVLIEKLNYMIHLLEEQQDERTNNVTEEVILYCFLGVFIIFIVDSFARVSKYTR